MKDDADRPSTLLERRLAHLRLEHAESMRDAVRQYVSTVKSARQWNDDLYPRGTEKELYAQFAHIILSDPPNVVAALLRGFATPLATTLLNRPLNGSWRAYRVSTVRRDLGTRWQDPIILPGSAGRGGIADVALLLNPVFGADEKQVSADLALYFELKSRDHHSQVASQLRSHLEAIENEPAAKNVYLASIGGGRGRMKLEHPRWIGHISLAQFFAAVGQVTTDPRAAEEIREVAEIVCAPKRKRGAPKRSVRGQI